MYYLHVIERYDILTHTLQIIDSLMITLITTYLFENTPRL